MAFVALMLTTASWTAAGRLKGLPHGRAIAVAGVLAGAVTTLVVIFALRLVDLEVRYLVAVAGIVIGNSMSAATLAGRNFQRSSQQRRGEIEAMFALGGSPQLAHEDIGREAVRESLLPNLDQTKSTGLVTLPGAFVGALFGGASPVGRRPVPAGGAGGRRARDDDHRDRGDPAGRPGADRAAPPA